MGIRHYLGTENTSPKVNQFDTSLCESSQADNLNEFIVLLGQPVSDELAGILLSAGLHSLSTK